MISKDEAGQRYKQGIENFGGAEQYISCGSKKGAGFLAVAKCLQDAKKANLTTANMVERYVQAA